MTHPVVRVLVAAVCICIGMIGLIMPILPGWVFFGFAAIVLFPDAPLTQRSVAKIEQKFPSSKRLLRFLHRPR